MERKKEKTVFTEMIFSHFFRKHFHFNLLQWCAVLPVKGSLAIIIAYCCLNLFVPACFDSLILQLTIAPWSALLLVFIFLYFSKNKIRLSCSFRKIAQRSIFKVLMALFLILLLSFISHYWSSEFFRFIGLEVQEKQQITETLKNASVTEMIIIGITVIFFAPIGEEIIFRRMLYGILQPSGTIKALFLTSFLFSIAHFYPVGIPGLFFLALILQLLYLHTKNIWCPIQAHMLLNILTFVSVLSTGR